MTENTIKYIYFIQDGLGNIKIGRSIDPEQRLRTLQRSNSSKLTLLLAINDFSENNLHFKFLESRMHGEWFKPSLGLLEFIEERKVKIEKEIIDNKKVNIIDMNATTVTISKYTRDKLRESEDYPREPFNSIVLRLIKSYKKE